MTYLRQNCYMFCAIKCAVLSAIFSFFFLSVCAQQTSAPGLRPNILLINIDDLGYHDVSLYGNRDFSTPNIQKLANLGMTFTNGYASASNCAPSRAIMMSGKFGTRHGVYTVGSSERGKAKDRKLIPIPNTETLADSIVTLAEELRDAGYETINIGKWHLGDDPRTQGFAVNIAGSHNGGPASYFSPYRNAQLKDGPVGEELTDRLTNEAINQLQKAKKPFFIYLPYFAVHTPLQAKKELIQKYMALGFKGNTAVYRAMVENMDQNIGRLIAALDSLKRLDNTIIIFTSDNGGLAGIHTQHPLRAGKGSFYEGGIKVPLLFVWKGHIKAGVTTAQYASNIDFYPTLLSLAGIAPRAHTKLDGVDISKVLLGKARMISRDLYWYFPIYLEANSGAKDEARDILFRTRPGMALRRDRWKLHYYFEDDAYELYDLDKDPGERNNIYDDHSANAKALTDKLAKWATKFNAATKLEINPLYRPGE